MPHQLGAISAMVLFLGCSPHTQGEVRRLPPDKAVLGTRARIVRFNKRRIARLWYRLTEPAIPKQLPPEPTFVLDLANGTETPIFIHRGWLHSRYDANSKTLYLEMRERPPTHREERDGCKALEDLSVQVQPHEVVQVLEHLPPLLGLSVRNLVVEIAWSDQPLIPLGDSPCSAASVAHLLSLERGVIRADTGVDLP
jgi:hypothetical protein